MWRAVLLVLVACGGARTTPAPAGPTCGATADHVFALIEPKDDHARRIRMTFAQRCEHDAWRDDVRACLVGTRSLKDPRHCKAKLTLDQRGALERDLAELERIARETRLPAACEHYKQVMASVMTCDRMTAQTRDALQQGFDAMSEGWKHIDEMSAEVRTAMEDSCKQAADALAAAAKDICSAP